MNLREIYELAPEPQRTELLNKIRHHWPANARPNQLADGPEPFQVIVGGRGSGKTRAGAEWIREKAKEPNLRLLVIARTAADVRNTVVEGESGILNVTPTAERPDWIPSVRRLVWSNGTEAFCTSSDEPDVLRGVQAHYTWIDEPNGKENPSSGFNTFANVCLATRLGSAPQILLTGTSQSQADPLWQELRHSFETKTLFRGADIAFHQNSTLDNEKNLATQYVKLLMENYRGTVMAGRELDGDI